MSALAENLIRVEEQIAEAAASAGRSVAEIELVAVSKTHPAERVQEIFDAGQHLFGESRVQEAREKIPRLPGAAHWHFIGHLQKKKIRHALPLFELFHGIDSLETAQNVDRIADELGLFPKILLEVNVAGESSKFGFSAADLQAQFASLLELPRVEIHGLMTIAPMAEDGEASRPYFAQLRELRDELQSAHAVTLPHLSMGMTNDYRVAIQEGATLVRVGTAIFGARSGRRFAPMPEEP